MIHEMLLLFCCCCVPPTVVFAVVFHVVIVTGRYFTVRTACVANVGIFVPIACCY